MPLDTSEYLPMGIPQPKHPKSNQSTGKAT